jgi:hypothetical protein
MACEKKEGCFKLMRKYDFLQSLKEILLNLKKRMFSLFQTELDLLEVQETTKKKQSEFVVLKLQITRY